MPQPQSGLGSIEIGLSREPAVLGLYPSRSGRLKLTALVSSAVQLLRELHMLLPQGPVDSVAVSLRVRGKRLEGRRIGRQRQVQSALFPEVLGWQSDVSLNSQARNAVERPSCAGSEDLGGLYLLDVPMIDESWKTSTVVITLITSLIVVRFVQQ